MKNIIQCLGAIAVVLAVIIIFTTVGYGSEPAPIGRMHTAAVSHEAIKPYEYIYYDVPLTDEQQRKIQTMAKDNNVPYEIVLGVMYVESRFSPDCIGDGGNSIGIMQIQPYWHSGRMERLGATDLTDVLQCAAVGIDYLAEKICQYGNLQKALVAYNAGHAYTDSNSYSRMVVEYAEALNER